MMADDITTKKKKKGGKKVEKDRHIGTIFIYFGEEYRFIQYST